METQNLAPALTTLLGEKATKIISKHNREDKLSVLVLSLVTLFQTGKESIDTRNSKKGRRVLGRSALYLVRQFLSPRL